MVLLDKLAWVEHEGPIYSVHAQPRGPRFATGGADSRVKVWSLAAALDAATEAAPGAPKLLALLAEHTGPVNVVRFSHSGRYLASGSDDKAVIVYELRPGAGGGALGATGQSLENWRPRGGGGGVLRGHDSNVSDLAWSADDSRIATAALDSTVMVWDAATGARVQRLEHGSHVKGVQWDLVGSYLATQCDDKLLRIYRTSTWADPELVDKPYRRAITTTFATRLSFPPDGSFLLTGNASQRGNHTAVVLPRGKWADPKALFYLAGHTGAVVSTACNPKLFHLPLEGSEPANGTGPAAVGDALTNVFATGDQDKRVVVWASGLQRPLFSGKAFFKRQVTDLSWTSDGYTLLACSADGTVGVFQFSPGELGRPSTREELEELKRELYGDRQRAAGGALLFAESVEELEAEEATRPQQAQQAEQAVQQQAVQQQAVQQQAQQRAPVREPLAEAPGPTNRQPLGPAASKPAKPSGGLDALTARLEGRMGSGGETQVGFGTAEGPGPGSGAARPAPVRAGDGRKRIVPEATAGGALPAGGEVGAMPPPPPRQPALAVPAPKRQRAERQPAAGRAAGGAAGGAAPAAAGRLAGPAAQAPAAAAVAAAAAPGAPPGPLAAPWAPMQLLPSPPVKPEWSVILRQDEAGPSERAAEEEQRQPPQELHILNRERGTSGRPQAELSCFRGGKALWSDLVNGLVVAACGTPNFAAVGLQDGSVLLYSPAGRRLGGPIKLGAGLAQLACNADWLLLALTTTGRVKLVHVGEQRTLLSTSVAPLVEDGAQVVEARLSRQGWPMLALSSHRAYLWHRGLEEWMCVAEEAHTSSAYMPTMRLQGQGELTSLQAAAVAGTPAAQPRALLSSRPAQHAQSRALLESNLAAAACLQSPQEYRRWLGTYAQHLAEMGDEGRLRELCMGLLGPLFGPAGAQQSQHDAAGGSGGDVAMAEAAADGSAAGAAAAAAAAGGAAGGAAAAGGGGEVGASGISGSGVQAWEPRVLGLDKRELLAGEVLRALGRNRSLAGLAGEMRDLLEDLQRLE